LTTSSREDRVDRLRVQLSLLSEAPAQSLRERVSRQHASSRPPAEAQPDREGVPSPDDSLLAYFLYRYENARSDSARVAVVAECEIRLQQRLNACSARVAGSMRHHADEKAAIERSEERDRRIAEDYPGLDPAEVAAIATEAYGWCSPANVRKCRLDRERDPTTGYREARPDDLVAYARQLKATGRHSISSIAMRVGKPKSTVQGWLAKDRAA
jgi:hypothetical protein